MHTILIAKINCHIAVKKIITRFKNFFFYKSNYIQEPVLLNTYPCFDTPSECDSTRGLACLGLIGKKKCSCNGTQYYDTSDIYPQCSNLYALILALFFFSNLMI